MRRGALKLRIPNPHEGDIGPALLKEILRQAGITREEWERT
jgi:predicted RNA binding protein YcfA (HicA-like mRNA interferase family)